MLAGIIQPYRSNNPGHSMLRSLKTWASLTAACIAFGGCAPFPITNSETAPTPQGSETVPPESVVPPSAEAGASTQSEGGLRQRGRISLYGNAFSGKRTASGDIFDPESLTMAHRTLPFGTRVRVTNLENRRSVEVIVNDRGPFVPGRIADVSAGAARQIGMVVDGVIEALLEVLEHPKQR